MLRANSSQQKITLIFIGGTLSGCGFILPSLWPLVFFGLLPIFSVLKKTQSWKQGFLYGYFFGLILYGFEFYSFFFDSLPFTWFAGADFGYTQYLIVGSGWLFTILLCSIATALFGALFNAIATWGWYGVLSISSLWVLTEWLGSVILSIGVMGTGSLIGPHITLGYLGNLLASNDMLLQFAFAGGVYGLSFIVVVINIIIHQFFYTHSYKKYLQLCILMFACVLLISIDPYMVLKTNEDSSKALTFLVLGTYVPYVAESDVKNQYHTDLTTLLSKTTSPSTDVIVFSEGYDYLHRQINRKEPLIHIGTDPFIIDSTIFNYSATSSSRVMQYFEPRDNTIQYTVKQFLVPIGEYTPAIMHSIARLLGFSESLERIEQVRHNTAGSQAMPVSMRGVPIGALFCNEVSSPELYRKQTYMGAQILINVASHSRHHGSLVFTTQLQHAARIRAVENARPMVVAHDMAPAFALDEHGKIIASTSGTITEAIEVSVTPSIEKTPYTTYGSSILFIPGYLIILFIYIKRKKDRFGKRKGS